MPNLKEAIKVTQDRPSETRRGGTSYAQRSLALRKGVNISLSWSHDAVIAISGTPVGYHAGLKGGNVSKFTLTLTFREQVSGRIHLESFESVWTLIVSVLLCSSPSFVEQNEPIRVPVAENAKSIARPLQDVEDLQSEDQRCVHKMLHLDELWYVRRHIMTYGIQTGSAMRKE